MSEVELDSLQRINGIPSNRRISIDSIRVVPKKPLNPPPRRKRIKWGSFIAIFLALNLVLWGSFAVTRIKAKIDALKLFRDGHYLVLLQNNAELRPSGGFIGTFATVSMKDYKLEKIDFNTNIYKLDNEFTKTNIVPPPIPLAKITNGRWALRDSNFAASFPEAAEKIKWFYETESGDRIDGIIAINASVIQEIIKKTGPIEITKYNTIITADNFFSELSEKIEKDYFADASNWQVNEPKSILKDLMPILFERAMKISKTDLVTILYGALKEKQIAFYANSENIEQAILKENWGGQIQSSESDYLAVINANITDTSRHSDWGAKTSRSIEESINYEVKESASRLEGNLNLIRSHHGTHDWPDGVNINWTRVLVPKGSELLTAELNGKDIKDSVEIGEEAGKTYFATWIDTAPGTSNVLNLRYTLPIKLSNYSLLAQKQIGAMSDKLTASFNDKVLFNGLLDEDKLIK